MSLFKMEGVRKKFSYYHLLADEAFTGNQNLAKNFLRSGNVSSSNLISFQEPNQVFLELSYPHRLIFISEFPSIPQSLHSGGTPTPATPSPPVLSALMRARLSRLGSFFSVSSYDELLPPLGLGEQNLCELQNLITIGKQRKCGQLR